MNEGGGESVAGTDGVGHGDVVAGRCAVLAVLEDGAAAFAEGNAHGFAAEAVAPAAAEIFDGVARTFGGIDAGIERFGFGITWLGNGVQRRELLERGEERVDFAKVDIVKAFGLGNRLQQFLGRGQGLR